MAPAAPQPSFLATRRGKLTLALPVRRRVPRLRRHLDRQRRAAVDPPRPALLGPEPAVGPERLPAHLRRLPAARRPRRRPARPPPHARRRHRAVRALLAGRRPGRQRGHADRGPPRPGSRRRHDDARPRCRSSRPAFNEGTDRLKALGAWGAMAGLASAVGVFLGGVLSGGPGWRWVFFVNPPVCATRPRRRLPADRRRRQRPRSPTSTPSAPSSPPAGMLAADLRARQRARRRLGQRPARSPSSPAPRSCSPRSRVNERRHPQPAVPALDLPHQRARRGRRHPGRSPMAGFYSMFFFITLYMQNVLRFSPTRGRRRLRSHGLRRRDLRRHLLAAASAHRHPADHRRRARCSPPAASTGSRASRSTAPTSTTCCPGLVIMSLGLGAVFVGVTTAANAGVPAGQGRPRRRLINASPGSAARSDSRSSPRSRPPAPTICWPHTRPCPRRSPSGSTARCSPAASSWSPPP